MSRKKSVTLQQLADELGLTIQTVSKALRGLPGMSEETRQAVVRTAAHRGYRTREQIQQLTQERISPYPNFQRRFLLVQSEQSLSFHKLLMRGLTRRFTEFGHRIEPLLLPLRMEAKRFEEWVQDNEVLYCDGIFITPRIVPDPTEDMLLALPVNRILINFPDPESSVDSVVWDVCEAIHQAIRHLVRAGHRRIMYVGDTASQRGFQLRWSTLQSAMEANGLAFHADEHCTVPRTAPADNLARLALGRLSDTSSSDVAHRPNTTEAWLDDFRNKFMTYRPSAVICGIDQESASVYYALQEMGCRVPEQISMIAFLNEQNEHLPIFTRPTLLIEETGYRVADRMLWRIANPTAPYEHVRLQGNLIAGNTVTFPFA